MALLVGAFGWRGGRWVVVQAVMLVVMLVVQAVMVLALLAVGAICGGIGGAADV